MRKLSINSDFISKYKNQIYLALILIVAFLVRLIPSRNLTFAGNDAYLHHDIVMRLVNNGLGIISNDPLSWMGLSSYGYPPLYHIIATLLYNVFHSSLVFFILPAILGVASILIFYKISQELFDNTNTAILATLLFAFVPSFVTRTAVFIPESMGIFFFTCILYFIIKYVKSIPGYENLDNFTLKGFLTIFKGNYKYLLCALAIWIFYLFTHRGWIFLAFTMVILVVTFILPSFKKKPVTVSLIFLILVAGFFEFLNIVGRFQDIPVTILGFPKWVGIIQLLVGIYGIVIFIKSKNALYRFLALWALIFVLLGTNSFRFRDPYAAIPLTLLGGYVLSQVVLPKINSLSIWDNYKLIGKNIGRYLRILVVVIIILTPVAQGAFMSYSSVVQASPGEVQAFNWIKEETPINATIVTLRDNAYPLIGNTNRKDVALWKTVYEGFMGNSPSLKETKDTVIDVDIIFGSSYKKEAYYLLDKYNVSYIYINSGMYNQPGTTYGLISYIPYDTHFKNSFVSGDASVYQYIAHPTLNPPTNQLNLSNQGEYTKAVNFIEEFWNGYSYSDIKGQNLDDPAANFEYGGDYKGYYNLNAQIAALYKNISQKTSASELNNRSEYLIDWLNYKQMTNGSFPSNSPPAEYTLGTMETLYPLMNLTTSNSNRTQILNKGLGFVNNQTGENFINISNTGTSPNGFIEQDYAELKTDSQVSGMYPDQKEKIINKLINKQENDGSWTNIAYQNVEILKGLSLYYNATGDKNVLNSIKKGSKWLKDNQNTDGSFKDDGDTTSYSISQYADAVLVYYTAQDRTSIQNTLNYISKQNLRMDITPLKSYLTLLSDLTSIYGFDTALKIANRLI